MCTGSFILAAAGVLAGKRATSNWQALDELRALGVEVVPERVVFDGKHATSAGVTAGLDMALSLAGKIACEQVAQAIQLGLEYDPQPPFDSGSPEKAPAEIVEAVFVSADEADLALFVLTGIGASQSIADVLAARGIAFRVAGRPAATVLSGQSQEPLDDLLARPKRTEAARYVDAQG